jgi:OLD-like protein
VVVNVDLATAEGALGIILVEGTSDRAALEALAVRRGHDLVASGVAIAAMGGATSIGHYLDLLGPAGRDVRLAGLCDAAEEGYFRRALQRAGMVNGPSRDAMEAAGFYVCDADLEDELIRALGAARVEEIIDGQGELRSFRTFQKQPAQQGRAPEAQLHRFMGTRSGRKSQYAWLLAAALTPAQVPRPLDRVLTHAAVRGRQTRP